MGGTSEWTKKHPSKSSTRTPSAWTLRSLPPNLLLGLADGLVKYETL